MSREQALLAAKHLLGMDEESTINVIYTWQVARELLAAQAEIERLRGALEWYGENARLCRLVHSGGDVGRAALADDGGKRARASLAASEVAA